MKKKYFIIFSFILALTIIIYGIRCFDLMGDKSEIEHVAEVDANIKEEIVEEVFEEVIEEPKISSINLLAVGDIMFHSPQYKAAYNIENSSYDFIPNFKYVKKHIKNAHLAIGNFETVTLDSREPSSFPRFNTPRESLLALKDAGFDILSTANNHCLDQGKQGIINTIDNIYEYGMKNIGTYKEPMDGVLIEEVEDIKIGFLSYTYGLNGLDSFLTKDELSYMINIINEEKIERDIEKAKEQSDLVVISIHWGNEYQREPSAFQMELGHKMIEWGANVILGSHPHVIQKTEIINKYGRDNFIVYSMGNFISNQRRETLDNPYTEDGVMISLEIEKDFASNSTIIKSIDYIPTWVYRYRENNKLKYEIIPIEDFLKGNIDIVLDKVTEERLKRSYANTLGKMRDDLEYSELN